MECESFWSKIYIAGPIHQAEQIIREFVMSGLCVNIQPTKYIYTGGEELGYVVELINYPRLPSAAEDILKKALELAEILLAKTYQKSYTVVTPNKSYYKSIIGG